MRANARLQRRRLKEKSIVDSVRGAGFAVVHAGETVGVEERASLHLGQDDPVVAGFHALAHLALDAREGVFDDGAAVGLGDVDVEVAETVFSGSEGL